MAMAMIATERLSLHPPNAGSYDFEADKVMNSLGALQARVADEVCREDQHESQQAQPGDRHRAYSVPPCWTQTFHQHYTCV
jgi:hypothetical protein